MCASFSMVRDSTRTRPPRTSTWRMETRSMLWLSKLEELWMIVFDEICFIFSSYYPFLTQKSFIFHDLFVLRVTLNFFTLDLWTFGFIYFLRWSRLRRTVFELWIISLWRTLIRYWRDVLRLISIFINANFTSSIILVLWAASFLWFDSSWRFFNLVLILNFHLHFSWKWHLLLESAYLKSLA